MRQRRKRRTADGKARLTRGTRNAPAEMMKNDTREDYVLRDAILKLLSDTELSNVSTEETETALTVGQEFIDLKNIRGGVQTCGADQVVMSRVLSRKSVHNDTWEKILAAIKASR
jgi:hypothetical protein